MSEILIYIHAFDMHFTFALKSLKFTWHTVFIQQDNAQVEPLQIFPLQRMSSHVQLTSMCYAESEVKYMLGLLHLFISLSGHCPNS